MIDAAIFHCNKDSKLHCEREQKLQRVPTALYFFTFLKFSDFFLYFYKVLMRCILWQFFIIKMINIVKYIKIILLISSRIVITYYFFHIRWSRRRRQW